MKITQKVFVPIKQYPKFNFTGKILGPKGNSLRRLQEETQCKIVIKGRNSMRDRTKEEELRSSGDPKYSHLNKDLFMEISTVATPAECYARIAYALAEVRKYLIPDKNDEVSHEQLRELMEMDPELAKNAYSGGGGPEMFKYMLLLCKASTSFHIFITSNMCNLPLSLQETTAILTVSLCIWQGRHQGYPQVFKSLERNHVSRVRIASQIRIPEF